MPEDHIIAGTSFDDTWLCREFEEFDEKLPDVAKTIVARGIDWKSLDAEDDDSGPEYKQEVFNSIFAILKEMVGCTSDMTAEEIDVSMSSVLIACHLIEMVAKGLVNQVDDGSYTLNNVGREYYNMLADIGVFDEDTED